LLQQHPAATLTLILNKADAREDGEIGAGAADQEDAAAVMDKIKEDAAGLLPTDHWEL